MVVRAELRAFAEARELTTAPNPNVRQETAQSEKANTEPQNIVFSNSDAMRRFFSPHMKHVYIAGHRHSSAIGSEASEDASGPVNWPEVFRKLHANNVLQFGYDQLVQAAEILGNPDVKKSSCRAVMMDYVNKKWLLRVKPGQFELSEFGLAELGFPQLTSRNDAAHGSRSHLLPGSETEDARDILPPPNINPIPVPGEKE